jgi:hypothetical protein
MGACYSETRTKCFDNYENMQSPTNRNNISLNITSEIVENKMPDITSEIVENKMPDITSEILENKMPDITSEIVENKLTNIEPIENYIPNIDDEFEIIN